MGYSMLNIISTSGVHHKAVSIGEVHISACLEFHDWACPLAGVFQCVAWMCTLNDWPKTLHVEGSSFLVGVTDEIESLMLVPFSPFPLAYFPSPSLSNSLLSLFFLPIPLSPSPYHHSPSHPLITLTLPPSHHSSTHLLITHSSLSLPLSNHSYPPTLSPLTLPLLSSIPPYP